MSARNMSAEMRGKKRAKLIRRDGRTCHWCGCRIHESVKPPERDALTLDHVKPLAEGGGHDLQNLVLACYPCNQRRGIDSWRAKFGLPPVGSEAA